MYIVYFLRGTYLLIYFLVESFWLLISLNELNELKNSRLNDFLGDNRERVTPLPIPNREVKPPFADGTTTARMWESRSLPGIFISSPDWIFSGQDSFYI
jgi:hypothetical protein